MNIFVIGCGRWGSLITWYLDHIGHHVTLYGRESSPRMQSFLATRQNDLLTLPESVGLTTDLRDVVLCMKGLEMGTGERLSVIAGELLHPSCTVAVWLGPGHVQEFYRGIPNCMVIDSENEQVKRRLVQAFSSDLIRFYYGGDMIGNEVGAAAKNVVGIAAGFLDGVEMSSLKGALMSRGTREVARLIRAMGGNELSAYGLCHLGDYEATVFSPYSHNRQFGESFIRHQDYHRLAEGYYTVEALMVLSERYQVELPICRAVHAILYENADPREQLTELLRRGLRAEFDD